MLGGDEIARFTAQGYLGPFELLPEPVALAIGKRLAEEVLPVRSPTYAHSPTDVPKLAFVRDRHLDSPLLARLLADERVVNRLTTLLGPDVLLWRSDFFMQAAGDRETLPHQDKNFSGMRNIPALEAPEGGIARNITAWIAFTPMDRTHGGLYLGRQVTLEVGSRLRASISRRSASARGSGSGEVGDCRSA